MVESDSQSLWVVGVALSLTATLFGTLGKVFLKLAHSAVRGRSVQLAATLCVFVLNPVFDALSYAYAAQVRVFIWRVGCGVAGDWRN